MNEESKPEIKPETRIICVCQKCMHHDSSVTALEFNFNDQKIYHICPACKHHNSMNIAPLAIPKSYPRTKTMR